jgi:hypothetical protein
MNSILMVNKFNVYWKYSGIDLNVKLFALILFILQQ